MWRHGCRHRAPRDGFTACPASGEDTAPESYSVALLKAMRTDHLDWSLPAYHRGTLRGMDAA
ncbi:hypothetical protein FFY45_21980 [Xanthomonas hortorum]|nr:hypothetical protein [Xanthomonas hortorum]